MKPFVLVAMVGLFLLTGTSASAQEDIIESVLKACEPEIEAYCSQVTPGEGRLLACFYAHGDKVSARCEYALYEGVAALEQFTNAVTYVATACHDDLIKHCGETEMGEGRVGTCLLEHKENVTEACRQAIDDTGLVLVEE